MIDTSSSKTIPKAHPYYEEIKGYRDLRDADKISRSMGWFFGVFGLTVALICVIGVIFIGSKSKFIPMVFIADSHGGLVYSGIVTDQLQNPQPYIANQLQEYIVNLRQVPQDVVLKDQYMHKVKMMSTHELFTNTVIPMITDRYMNNIGKTVKVSIRNTIQISKNTWQLDWDEKVGEMPSNRFKGAITFSLDPAITDPAILLYDPLGMVISDININQEVSQ